MDQLRARVAAMVELSNQKVMVGVPAEEALRKPDPEEPKPVNNAFLAYIHENGAPEIGLPARPFLKPAILEMRSEIRDRLMKIGRKALAGDRAGVDAGFMALGLRAQAAVRRKITTGPFKELAARTLAHRRARGRTGDRPLVDTGQLRQAINFVIRRNK